MSEREKAMQLIKEIPDSKMIFVVNMLMKIKGLPVEEIELDEWDLEMIEHAQNINDGHGIPIETLASELGVKL